MLILLFNHVKTRNIGDSNLLLLSKCHKTNYLRYLMNYPNSVVAINVQANIQMPG